MEGSDDEAPSLHGPPSAGQQTPCTAWGGARMADGRTAQATRHVVQDVVMDASAETAVLEDVLSHPACRHGVLAFSPPAALPGGTP
eukprot:11574077-Prorocentrum_lima.AAC.1